MGNNKIEGNVLKKLFGSRVVPLLAVGLLLPSMGIAQTIVPSQLGPATKQVTMPLTELAARHEAAPFSFSAEAGNRTVPNMLMVPPRLGAAPAAPSVDPLRQIEMLHPSAPTPPPILSFDGTNDDDNAALLGFRIVPPDTNGDIGMNYYVQMNNLIFEIFDKDTGSSVLGPLPNNIFFAGTGVACDVFNDGDPIVLYDHELKRWVFSQFAIFEFLPGPGTFVSHQCFAISQTSDPLGAYYLYQFTVSVPQDGGFAALNDYPKIGVWPDGYYMTFNEFEIGGSGTCGQFTGAAVVAVDKHAMANGAPASGLKAFLPCTNTAPLHFSLQPSHWEGNKKPKVNGQTAPNIILQAFDDETWGNGGGQDGYYHWAFSADFNNLANSTFTPMGLIPSASFDSNLCNFADCIPQPAPAGAADVLDTLSQFTMYRAAYRSFNNGIDGLDSIVVSHSVDADGADTAGMRWAELRNKGGSWAVHQAGTYAPADGENRWMGSVAQDRKGNIALGYSVSSTSTFPSIRYTGRSAHDTLGQMGSEQSCHAGSGSQIGSANRWGDYSSMSVDPEDNCTFWYTNEYYANSGSFDFNTRVCSFRFDNCDPDEE